MLRLNGYSTGAFGKWHETAAWETSVSGPFDRWPTHQGFDKFYGFIGGETDQWYPLIYDGVDQGRSAEDGELPLHRRHDQPGHQLGEGAAVDDAGQAVLRLLRDRRDACAAPRAEGVGRQVQGPVRQGLGRRSAPKRSSGRRSWAWSRRTRSWPTGRRTSRRGTRCRPISGVCSRARPKCSRDSWSRPTARSAASRRRSRTSARWTTRCSSTSPATTAPAPRAASSACTTR